MPFGFSYTLIETIFYTFNREDFQNLNNNDILERIILTKQYSIFIAVSGTLRQGFSRDKHIGQNEM